MKIVKTSLTVETTFPSLRSLEHELGMVYHCGVCLADNEDHSIQTEAGWSTVEDELEELHENGMLFEELYQKLLNILSEHDHSKGLGDDLKFNAIGAFANTLRGLQDPMETGFVFELKSPVNPEIKANML